MKLSKLPIGWGKYLSLCILTGLVCGLVILIQTQAEANLPKEVQEDLNRQLHAFNIPDYVKGMPWLDKSKNWSDFNNWPDQVNNSDTIYALTLRGSDYDMHFDIKSRQEVKPGKDFSAHLIPRDFPTTNHILAGVYCYWSKGQKVESGLDGVSGGYIRKVFSLRFYPTGELHAYSRNLLGSRAYRSDYFDKNGKLVGYLTYPEAQTGTNTYVWGEVNVSPNEFFKRADELHESGRSTD